MRSLPAGSVLNCTVNVQGAVADPRRQAQNDQKMSKALSLRFGAPAQTGSLLQARAAGGGVALGAGGLGTRNGAARLLLAGLDVAEAACAAHGFHRIGVTPAAGTAPKREAARLGDLGLRRKCRRKRLT